MTKKEFEKLKGIVAENVDRVSELENRPHPIMLPYTGHSIMTEVSNSNTDVTFLELLLTINIVMSLVTLIIVFVQVLD